MNIDYTFKNAARYFNARFQPSTVARHWDSIVAALIARRGSPA